MTHLHIFLFFLGLVPLTGEIETTQPVDEKPVYQSIEGVTDGGDQSSDSEITQCAEWPACPPA